MPRTYLSNMNLKRIIREELEGFEWIENTIPLQAKEWVIYNDNSESDPYMIEIQKFLFGLGWKQERWKNQDYVPSDEYEKEQYFHPNLITFQIYSVDRNNKIFGFSAGPSEVNGEVIKALKNRKDLDVYTHSEVLSGNFY